MTDKELQEMINKKVEYQHKKHIQEIVKKDRVLSEEDYESLKGIATVELKKRVDQELIGSIQECDNSIKEIQKGIAAIQEMDINQCSNKELVNITGTIAVINTLLGLIVGFLNE